MLRICILCANADAGFRSELLGHMTALRRRGVNIWHDNLSEPGRNQQEERERELRRADLVLMLISADFLSDDSLYDALGSLRRQGSRCQHIAVRIRAVEEGELALNTLRWLPDRGKTISESPDRDRAWQQIAAHVAEGLGVPGQRSDAKRWMLFATAAVLCVAVAVFKPWRIDTPGGPGPSQEPIRRVTEHVRGMVLIPSRSILYRGVALRVPAFYLDRTEVPVAAYQRCVAGGGCPEATEAAGWPGISYEARERLTAQCNARRQDRANHPMNCISQEMAARYCSSIGRRLPKSEEWQSAASAAGGPYPWGREFPTAKHLNACGLECAVSAASEAKRPLYLASDGYPTTAPVDGFSAGSTPDGILHLGGNVAEWTATSRTMRGAAWNTSWEQIAQLQVDAEYKSVSDARMPYYGFRCAADGPK